MAEDIASFTPAHQGWQNRTVYYKQGLPQGFHFIPASDDAPDGWGRPRFNDDGSTINDPMGTVGGEGGAIVLRKKADGEFKPEYYSSPLNRAGRYKAWSYKKENGEDARKVYYSENAIFYQGKEIQNARPAGYPAIACVGVYRYDNEDWLHIVSVGVAVDSSGAEGGAARVAVSRRPLQGDEAPTLLSTSGWYDIYTHLISVDLEPSAAYFVRHGGISNDGATGYVNVGLPAVYSHFNGTRVSDDGTGDDSYWAPARGLFLVMEVSMVSGVQTLISNQPNYYSWHFEEEQVPGVNPGDSPLYTITTIVGDGIIGDASCVVWRGMQLGTLVEYTRTLEGPYGTHHEGHFVKVGETPGGQAIYEWVPGQGFLFPGAVIISGPGVSVWDPQDNADWSSLFTVTILQDAMPCYGHFSTRTANAGGSTYTMHTPFWGDIPVTYTSLQKSLTPYGNPSVPAYIILDVEGYHFLVEKLGTEYGNLTEYGGDYIFLESDIPAFDIAGVYGSNQRMLEMPGWI